MFQTIGKDLELRQVVVFLSHNFIEGGKKLSESFNYWLPKRKKYSTQNGQQQLKQQQQQQHQPLSFKRSFRQPKSQKP